MTSPAVFAAAAAATPINLSPPTVKSPVFSPFLSAYSSSDSSLKIRNQINRRSNPLPSIKSAASDSTAIADNPPPASTSEDEEFQAKIGARVRVKVPLKVYHIPKVSELDLNGKEGRIKQYVAVWKGKHISANLPFKIEFFEKLEGRGDAPVKFFAHLKEDEFEYLD
ncbi:hypothetical protein SSX86_006917 [Deinandra increscens subsp. villosa]|uniref:Ferredoxin thioredoxin reductase alpha chain domain-containing protein n=1 Tax=Deinandra increscens subsp. villosa TaxID=3103831 RepID=A0AAP0DNI1_9ASTR